MKRKGQAPITENKVNLEKKDTSIVFYIILLILFILTTVLLARTSATDRVIRLGSTVIPIRNLSGVISSVANICLIFMVVFFNKLGFITSLTLLGVQVPIMIVRIITQNNITAISGLFTNLATLIAIILIYRRNKKIDDYQIYELEYVIRQKKMSENLFDQTITALINAIDSKDPYTRGHSVRVAEYSVKIAERLGKSDEDRKKIYYAALLHDVGKLGLSEAILTNPGRFTPEEYEIVKKHTVIGNLILSGISEYPYICIGAHFHHERYDGKGYPIGLKGEDIPEIARIISVADAYDAMTSRRSYRDALPQPLVREEIIKCSGTQFDPAFAKIMQEMIDDDNSFLLREEQSDDQSMKKKVVECPEYRKEVSDGVNINDCLTRIHLKKVPAGTATYDKSGVAMILFDSLDGHYHSDEKSIKDLHYFEYCEIWVDGNVQSKEVRKIQSRTIVNDSKASSVKIDSDDIEYDIEAVRIKDHMLIRIIGQGKTIEITIALPDSSRFAYIGLTGMYCHITDLTVNKDEKHLPQDYIPRIAEEISYINVPAGDIPNIQIDSHRSAYTDGIPLDKELEINFHSMSLPTAGLIWHCPYFIIFYSDNGKINGANYKEYSLTRLDGENIETAASSKTDLRTSFDDGFGSWDEWKDKSKAGFDGSVKFVRDENVVTMTADNLGIYIENTTTILDGQEKLYVALTGDEVAITNIRLKKS